METTLLIVFGTRPEAIKMAPLVSEAKRTCGVRTLTCATGQHREMLDQVLKTFGVVPDESLELMSPGQSLFDVTTNCMIRFEAVLAKHRPDFVLVQGDTTTTLVAALAAFYARVPVGHVEAGLRTGNTKSPFPEEANRRLVTPLADLHFAPTEPAAENLRKEGVAENTILVTGNTSIDALLEIAERAKPTQALGELIDDRELVLLTAHRRENFGAPLENVFRTMRSFAEAHPQIQVLCPVHPNPNVRGVAWHLLGGLPNIVLSEPLDYETMVWALKRSRFVVTDSGGVQEEAPSLGKPVLVLRDTTERPEAIAAGNARLVGCHPERLRSALEELTFDTKVFREMSRVSHVFGDGHASRKIIQRVLEWCESGRERKRAIAVK